MKSLVQFLFRSKRLLTRRRLKKAFRRHRRGSRGNTCAAAASEVWAVNPCRARACASPTSIACRSRISASSIRVGREKLTPVDVIDNGETVDKFPPECQDFLIANVFLEHADRSALLESIAAVAAGRRAHLAVPNRHHTFDRDRQPTKLEHLVRDHRRAGVVVRRPPPRMGQLVDHTTGEGNGKEIAHLRASATAFISTAGTTSSSAWKTQLLRVPPPCRVRVLRHSRFEILCICTQLRRR